MGGPSNFRLERILEAAQQPETNLMYTALTGQRKQSVSDVKRFFNQQLIDWLNKQNYSYKVKYMGAIHNWRLACDERGLTQAQRSEYNKAFLELILDELMPWHKYQYDFSTLEVNR